MNILYCTILLTFFVSTTLSMDRVFSDDSIEVKFEAVKPLECKLRAAGFGDFVRSTELLNLLPKIPTELSAVLKKIDYTIINYAGLYKSLTLEKQVEFCLMQQRKRLLELIFHDHPLALKEVQAPISETARKKHLRHLAKYKVYRRK